MVLGQARVFRLKVPCWEIGIIELDGELVVGIDLYKRDCRCASSGVKGHLVGFRIRLVLLSYC